MAGLNKPIVLVEESPSGLVRQRWIFTLLGNVLLLERYHYERRHTKKANFKVTKLYDRGREPDEDYGDWTWLNEEDVPWDEDLKGEALGELVRHVVVGRQSDFNS